MTAETVENVRTRQYYPALRGLFGDWVYYSCLMSMKEVSVRLSFADEVHESKKMSEWIQRNLKKGRSKEIAQYLVGEPQRFFNSLVVAIYGGDPSWHSFSNFKPLADDIDLANVPSDVEDSVGFLSFSGQEKMFAIDGQHRLAGIKRAVLEKPTLGKDEVSLVLVAHQTSQSGLERTRRLFTTLNKMARPVGKGEIIALDENDAVAILTRQFVEHDPHFSVERIKLAQSDSLAADAPEWTTIGNLYDVLTVVLERFGATKKAHLRSIRPTDEELKQYTTLGRSFFAGLVSQSKELKRYFDASSRQAPKIIARYRHNRGGHILFRPAGIRLFAEVAGDLVRSGLGIEESFDLLGRLPSELSDTPYRGVIWLANGKMSPSGRSLCRRLLLYMLGYEKNPDALLERYAYILGERPARVALPGQVI